MTGIIAFVILYLHKLFSKEKPMKIAIVCDWLVTAGGAERVIQHLLECYPEADLFSVIDFFTDSDRKEFLKNKKAITTFIQKIPYANKLYRSLLPLMPMAIEQLDVSNYDLIISSSHAVAKGVLTGPDQLHISYVHSPMRYAWDLQHQYLKEANLTRGLKGFLAHYFLHKLRIWDHRTANQVDYFVANSDFIARRIFKIYHRKAEVIYPPVDTDATFLHEKREEFYLTASRLVPYKKIDLIVETFAYLPDKKLIVIGDGPEMKKIAKKSAPNIELMGFQPSEILNKHLQQAKAFIFAAEEDFGMLPVEAQAFGTPVIAFGKGGCLETVRDLKQDQPTGLFFSEQTIESLSNAIAYFEENQEKFIAENCITNSKRFSANLFQEKFKHFVQEKFLRHKDAYRA